MRVTHKKVFLSVKKYENKYFAEKLYPENTHIEAIRRIKIECEIEY